LAAIKLARNAGECGVKVVVIEGHYSGAIFFCSDSTKIIPSTNKQMTKTKKKPHLKLKGNKDYY